MTALGIVLAILLTAWLLSRSAGVGAGKKLPSDLPRGASWSERPSRIPGRPPDGQPHVLWLPEELPEILYSHEESGLASAIARQYTKKDHYYRLTLASGEEFAVGATVDEAWLDVITRKRRKGERAGLFTGAYDCFGYSIIEGRWSYGEGPPGAGEIRRLLARHFGAKERGRWT